MGNITIATFPPPDSALVDGRDAILDVVGI